jgi:hypothetical protein
VPPPPHGTGVGGWGGTGECGVPMETHGRVGEKVARHGRVSIASDSMLVTVARGGLSA